MPTLAIELFVAVVPVAWTLPPAAAGPLASLALATGLFGLLSARRAIFKTTLTSAWWWTLAAVCSWSAVELLAATAVFGVSAIQSLRFAAITVTLCPVIALLGAKRPQHAAWNFVVASLWGVLTLPAMEAFFLRGGSASNLGALRTGFLCLLVLLGPINFVPTRSWLPSLLVAAGQLIGFLPFLFLTSRLAIGSSSIIGLLLTTSGLVLARLIWRRKTCAAYHYNRLWLDFRDSYGLLWALRVQERVNAAAAQYGWNLVLTWRGFKLADGSDLPAEIDPATESSVRSTLDGLLRRFRATS